MAGLDKDNFKEEILTEISWIMTAIDEISEKLDFETYETVLIKYRVQPEEERIIDKFIFLNWKKMDDFSIFEIQNILANNFFELTGKKWTLCDEVVEKILKLKRNLLNDGK